MGSLTNRFAASEAVGNVGDLRPDTGRTTPLPPERSPTLAAAAFCVAIVMLQNNKIELEIRMNQPEYGRFSPGKCREAIRQLESKHSCTVVSILPGGVLALPGPSGSG